MVAAHLDLLTRVARACGQEQAESLPHVALH